MSSPPDPVEVHPPNGRMPALWRSEGVFVANLLGLFFGNEEETRMLADEVGEVDSYGGRLLPIIDLLFAGRGRNLLVLEREPDPFLTEFFADRAGLSLPEIGVLPHRDYLALGARSDWDHEAIERIGSHSAGRIDGYVTDDTLAGIARHTGKKTLSTVSGSRTGNNKWLLHRHLEECGLPTPPTEVAEGPGDVRACLDRLVRAGFRSAAIKAALGASGIGLTKVDDIGAWHEERDAIPEHLFREGPSLVQGWLRPGERGIMALRSPSVQLFLDDTSVSMFDITEQILSHDSVHEGNESPPPYLADRPDWRDELLRQAETAARWLHGRGYRGTASVDFLVTEEETGFTVYVCEINARVTGATYPSLLAKHFLPEGAWLLRNLRFAAPLSGRDLLDLLSEAHDLFVPGESEFGVFPVNFNFGSDGLIHKGQFLCLAPSSSGSQELLRIAELDLPCAPDRD